MNRWIYVSVGTGGGVFTLLEYTIADNLRLASSILFLTIFLLGLLYLIDEIRFYREHNALLASAQFLIIPGLLMTVGNVLAPLGFAGPIFSLYLNMFGGFEIIFTLTSLIILLPLLFFLALTARYYDNRYPGFVIRRRQFGSFAFPFIIHLFFISLMIFLISIINYIDIITTLFVIASVTQLISKKVLPLFQTDDQVSYRPRERRGFLNSLLGRSSRRRSRSSRSNRPSSRSDSAMTSQSSPRTRQASNQRQRNRSSSRRSGQPVSTTPSDGYREIPTRSRNERRNRSSDRPTVAEVDRGKEMVPPTRKVKKRKSRKLSNYLPKGNYTKDDLRCTICYEDFKKSKNNVLICPNCKFPAHERELRSWLNQSNRCPRCNKDIRSNKALKSSSLISESQYVSLIRKI